MNVKNKLSIAWRIVKLSLLVGLLISVGLLILGIGGYFIFEETRPPLLITKSPLTPYLTTDMALSLLQEKGLLFFTGCTLEGEPYNYQSCVIEIAQEENQWTWIVTITYDGLFDDSIRATRIKAIIAYQDDQWIVKESSETQKCWPNRGHQDFSTEFCV